MKRIFVCLSAIILLYTVSPINSINTIADELSVEAPAAIVLSPTTDTIMFEKNIHEHMFPASTTKIMTALLVLEHCKRLDERITMSHDAIYKMEPGSSHIAMNEGETLTVRQALYALLIASANEVANALAEYVSGDVKTFCELMNTRAKQLDATDSHFVNPHGFHNTEHYTSCHDLAIIMQECVKYPEFVKIINTKRYDIPPTEKQPESRVMHNTNKMIQEGRYYNSEVVGGKTGFTDEAGHTLVTYGKRNGNELIVVVMKEKSENAFVDTTKLLNYGFDNFETISLDTNEFEKTCEVLQSGKVIDNVNVKSADAFEVTVPNMIKREAITLRTELSDKLQVPIKKDVPVGKIVAVYKNKILGSVNLLPQENILPLDKKVFERMQQIALMKVIIGYAIKFLIPIIIFLLAIVFVIRQVNKRRRRRRR